MGTTTQIEWCDKTWNSWYGCTKVSPACLNCYAEAMMDHRFEKVQWGPDKARVRTSEQNWKLPYRWDRQAAKTGISPSVFALSLGDWLDDEVPIEWLADFLIVLAKTPHLRWLLLTKRPRNYITRVPEAFEVIANRGTQGILPILADMLPRTGISVGLPNVAIGITAEDQRRLDERLPSLFRIPAAMRFISAEPLLQAVDLYLEYFRVDWVICGGESGYYARSFDLAHARRLRSQCADHGIAFFMKQLGCNWHDSDYPEVDGYQGGSKWGDISQFSIDLQVREFPAWLQRAKEVSHG